MAAELVGKCCALLSGHALLPSCSQWVFAGWCLGVLHLWKRWKKQKNPKPLSKVLSFRTQWHRGELCTNHLNFWHMSSSSFLSLRSIYSAHQSKIHLPSVLKTCCLYEKLRDGKCKGRSSSEFWLIRVRLQTTTAACFIWVLSGRCSRVKWI